MNRNIENNSSLSGPYAYSQYEELGNVRDRIAKDLNCIEGSQILDVGTGNGLFAFAMARSVTNAQILGMDMVEGTLRDAVQRAKISGLSGRCRFACNDFLRVRLPERSFDVITFFLSLCDLLRLTNLEAILRKVTTLLNDSGRLVICEGFPEDAQNQQQALGFALNEALGYRYRSKCELISVLNQLGMGVDSISTYLTKRAPLDAMGVQDFIRDECFFCTLDGSSVPSRQEIWQVFQPLVLNNGGLEIDAQISVITASNVTKKVFKAPNGFDS